jgi:hypothetical protein
MISVLAQLVAIGGLLSGLIAPPVALGVVLVQFVVGLAVTFVECRARLSGSSGVVS